MSRNFRVVKRARADVDRIFNWLLPRSVQGAISWYIAFQEALREVADNPESFGLAPEADRVGIGIRQALFKTRRGRYYRVVFEVTDTTVLVLRVRGSGQKHLSRRDLPKK
jgi:plasmid stabilization system protein ParE